MKQSKPNRIAKAFVEWMLLILFLISQDVRGVESAVGIRMVPELSITGTIGSTNVIQYVDVLKNTNDWITLANIVLKTSPYLYHDSSAPIAEHRYYRVINLGGGSATNQPAGGPADMAWVAPGQFIMGSPDTDLDRTDFEIPQSKVVFTYGYWIAKYEVTQERYLAVVGNNPSETTDTLELPVDSVTWSDATNFCALLTEKERKAGTLPAGYAYRLPTEAEWEYAARAGKTTRFSYGNDIDYVMLDNFAWTSENSANTTHPVGTKSANAWGLFDMYGNVAEWCLDRFALYTADDKINPKGPSTGADRVFRGGSWADPASSSRSSARGGLDPQSRLSSFGFRVVLAPVN